MPAPPHRVPTWLPLLALAAVIVPALAAHDVDDLVLLPPQTGSAPIGVVLVSANGIAPSAYKGLAIAAQTALLASYNLSAWVGIPALTQNTSDPAIVAPGLARIQGALQAAGLPASAPVVAAAHSNGGVGLQQYTAQHPSAFVAQILLGAFVSRSQLNTSQPIALPTLTVGGELDGVARITRIAESYYHEILHARGNFTRGLSVFPVTVILGMSHMQFASGPAPPLIAQYDLKPEIDDDTAHALAAQDIAAFIAANLPKPDSAAIANITARVAASGAFFSPLISGFEMEASYHLKPPCYDDPPSDKCLIGCPWNAIAQVLMGNVSRPTLTYNVTDGLHPAAQVIPDYLPHVKNKCLDAAVPCVLQMITVSQNIYEDGDALDNGLSPVSASEIRAKLKSRQVVYESTGLPADFNETDVAPLCADINAAAMRWAINASGPATRARYLQHGEFYVMGDDLGPYIDGGLWIILPLVYEQPKGAQQVTLRSPTLRTKSSLPLPPAAGMHYCKLLSPSRALEWMYVDSLRLHNSLRSQ
eukprot:m.29237 g.29237  ORF g.29237 m.29237 type:complete len:532 (-) comp4643_c0_seq1:103-1698(-)